MALKAVLFDMDGVIVDTEPLHRKAYFQMFDDLELPVSEEFYESFTGLATKKVSQKLIKKFELSHHPDELNAHKRRYFKEYFDNDPDFDLLPGVRDLIMHYHQNDVKLVLASSASMDTIRWVFEKFDIDQYFLAKISGADLKESKPNPEIFTKAAELAQEPHENCMVIEDSTNGIRAAHAAGIFSAAYKSPHSAGQDYALANIVVEDFSELEVGKMAAYFN